LGRLGGDAPEVLGRVVPLPGDVAVLVELLAVDADVARVGVDGDDGFLGGLGHALIGGDEGVGQGVEQDVDGDALLPGDQLEGFEELEVVLLAHGRVLMLVLPSSSSSGAAIRRAWAPGPTRTRCGPARPGLSAASVTPR